MDGVQAVGPLDPAAGPITAGASVARRSAKAGPPPLTAAALERRSRQMAELAAREQEREALATIRLELEEVRAQDCPP